VDLVLCEGFARESYPKIEVHRPALGEPPRCWPGDPMVIAVATDAPLAVARPVQRLDLNAPLEVTAFLLDHLSEWVSAPAEWSLRAPAPTILRSSAVPRRC